MEDRASSLSLSDLIAGGSKKAAPLPTDRAGIFQAAFDSARQELDTELRAQPFAQPPKDAVEGTLDAVNSAGLGVAKAVFETKDALTTGFGMWPDNKPTYDQKSDIRKAIENDAAVLDRKSVANQVVGDISQFVTGMVGLGKITKGIKAVQELGAIGKVGFEIGKGMVVGSTVFDPQEERLSNFIESYPNLHNPITDYLAADFKDSDAEGRLKAALEGAGLDLALSATFAAAVKVFKAIKGSQPEAVVKAAQDELDAALEQQSAGGFNPDGRTIATPTGANPIDQAIGGKTAASDPTASFDMTNASSGGKPDPMVKDLMQGLDPPPQLPRGANVLLEGVNAGAAGPGGNAPGGILKEIEKELTGPTPEPRKIEGLPPAPTTPSIETQATGNAPAPGKATPSVDSEAESVNALMDGWKADANAIAKYGSREAAEENGYKFAQSGQLPWQKLSGEGDMQAFTERVATAFEGDLNTLKGGDVMSDSRVASMVGQRMWLYGDDPAALMGMIKQAGGAANRMVANMEAGFLVANKALTDTYKLASQIRMGSLADFGGDTVAAETALRTRLRFSIEALGNSKAMSANAGRALRRMRGEFRVTPEQLSKLESLDIDRITSLLYESQGNPKKLAKMADPGWLDRVVRGTGSIMANNLLWGWPSHVVNTITSAYMAGIRPAERIVGSFFNGGGSAMRTRALREYRYMASSLGDAWHFGFKAFMSGDSVLAPHETEWFKVASKSMDGDVAKATEFVPTRTVGDVFKNGFTALDAALRFPTRALGSVDEFIKQMSYRGYVQAEASIRADQLGLKGNAFKAYVEQALDESFDAAYRATDKDALYEAQVRTFSQPLLSKTLGSTLQNAVATHPSLRAIFPFVRTPINVFRYTIKNLPILNLAQKEYREMISGKMGAELQANAIGQMAIGSTALAVGGVLTADGKLTGGGPKDPSLRQALEATGWKPYSFVKENPDGSHTYVPFNRFDPAGLVFGIAADITEMMVTYPERNDEGENLAVAAAIAVAKNISDKTYLQNINAFMRAASDPEASFNKFAGQLGEGLIPFSSLLRQFNPDPYMREARSLVDNVLDRMPGFSDKLPPVRDPFGYPMKVRTGLVFQDNADDIVDAEQIRLFQETGSAVSLPTGYKREGLDLRDVHLTIDGKDRTAWDLLQEIAIKPNGATKTMKEAIAEEIKSKRYQMAPDGDGQTKGTKLFILRGIVGDYREAAYKQLVKQFPKEIGEPIARRSLEAREAWRQAKEKDQASTSQVDQLRDLAASYGIKIPQGQ